jgi:hypothetical protein
LKHSFLFCEEKAFKPQTGFEKRETPPGSCLP